MKKTIGIIVLFYFTLFFTKNISAEVPLLKNEKIIFYFETTNSKEVYLVKDTSDEYLVYRIYKKGKAEMEFPEKTNESWKKFTYSFYLRGGGTQNEGRDLNYIYFINDNFKYIIYDTFSASDPNPTIGVKVINTKTGETVNIKGKYKTKKGNLIDFRDNNLINKGEEIFD